MDPSVLDFNQPPPSQPSLWCPWIPSQNGSRLQIEDVKSYYYVIWLEYMIKNFFKPWKINVNGNVAFQGDNKFDRGKIFCKDNSVKIVYQTFSPDEDEDDDEYLFISNYKLYDLTNDEDEDEDED